MQIVRISVHVTSVQTRYPHRLNSYSDELQAKQKGCRDICPGEKISVKVEGIGMSVKVEGIGMSVRVKVSVMGEECYSVRVIGAPYR